MSRKSSPIRTNISKGDQQYSRGTVESFALALDYYLEAAFNIVETNWHFPVRQKVCSITTADINGDGIDEVLFGTEGHQLFAVKSHCARGKNTPELIWKTPFQTNAWVTGIAVLNASDGNDHGRCKKRIIVASDILYVLDENGEKQNELQCRYPLSSLQVYNETSYDIIVTGDIDGNVRCYNEDFTEVWSFPFKKSNYRIIDLSIGDFDGDGKIEVAAASEDKYVYIIDNNGEEKDKIDVKHWIVNMADCRMKNSKLRLFVGKFTGDTLVYKHKQTSQAVCLKQSGILDLKVEYIFDDTEYPQFVVGSSDRSIYIFDYSGKPIWVFESGLGQRSLSLKKTGDGKVDLFVGTESGDVFYYSVTLDKQLVSKISETYNRVRVTDLLDLNLSYNKLKILRNYVEYNPINQNASLDNAISFFEKGDFNNAVVSAMEVWFNNCSFEWCFSTGGRVYDLASYNFFEQHGLLVGSDDGILYCLDRNGILQWSFESRRDLRGIKQGIRGVYSQIMDDYIFTASVDRSLYCLDSKGVPLWNFMHDDWILFTCCGSFGEGYASVFAGTEDGYVLAFDTEGLLLWKTYLGKRVRALAFCKDFQGNAYLIAGCDDSNVYKIDRDGAIFDEPIKTPHYVLVVQSVDINNDGIDEILTGNEDGCLHVYDFSGNLLWRFKTESWVAALDVFDVGDGEKEIVIGSQDNHIYALNKFGALKWQYEANARVRTINADGDLQRIAFGSYDKNAYMLKKISRDDSVSFLEKLYIENVRNPIGKEEERLRKILYESIPSRHKRAFAYLFMRNSEMLRAGLSDTSDIVLAAIGSNLVENELPQNKGEDILTELLIKSNQRVKAVILNKLIQLMRESKVRKLKVSKILSDVIVSTPIASSKIDVFRFWISMTSNCDDILHMMRNLIPAVGDHIDEYLIDELNRASVLVLNSNIDECGDYSVIQIVQDVIQLIDEKYPTTACKLRKTFL